MIAGAIPGDANALAKRGYRSNRSGSREATQANERLGNGMILLTFDIESSVNGL